MKYRLQACRGDTPRLNLALVLALLCASYAAGCSNPAPPQANVQAAAGASSTPTVEPADETPSPDAIAIRVAPARRDALSAFYTTSATLRADKQATVTARTHGVVRQLLVEEGAWVEQDQPLAILENEEQQIELRRATTNRDARIREYERAEKLYGQGLMSEEEYETIRREADESTHSATLSELMLQRTVIRAPFAGRILRRHLDVGATVSDGTAVYDLADLDPLYADVNVPERQLETLATGQIVRLATDEQASDAIAARIERIAPLVDSTTGTVKVTIAVDRAARLRPGSFVRVEIVIDTHSAALVVPRSALVAEGRNWHVFRLIDDGQRVERLSVARGFEEGDRVEIAETVEGSSDLGQGDRVVVVGASALTDGAEVQVIEAARDDTPADAVDDEETRVAT